MTNRGPLFSERASAFVWLLFRLEVGGEGDGLDVPDRLPADRPAGGVEKNGLCPAKKTCPVERRRKNLQFAGAFFIIYQYGKEA